MNWKVPLSDLSFSAPEFDAIRRVLDSGWISMGPETEQFELEFASFLGVKQALAVSSGTAALHLALLALGIGPGDEVIVPSLTFVATANAVRYVGAVPVFMDICDSRDWNASPESLTRKISCNTRAVIVVHYAGFPCRMDEIAAIARRAGIKIVEDVAHAPGASYQGRLLGTWGDAGCFSFFSNKNVTCGEGGMVVTDDADVSRKVAILRSHGMTSLTWDRHRGHGFSYDVVETGYNYRIDEMRASLARVQLSKLAKNNQKRREITLAMRTELHSQPGITIPFADYLVETSACHIFPIMLDKPDLRQEFMRHMKSAGIQTSIHYPPIHKFSSYARLNGDGNNGLDVTEDVAKREVTLPLFPHMDPDRIELVCENAKAFFRK
jgi:dTDP-4-amino-4,6-dideoxygalactose transaminase